MHLDEFITETLTSIIKGVKNSQEFAKENDAVVNPYLHQMFREKIPMMYNEMGNLPRPFYQLNFDIAVTAAEETGKSGHGGINVLSLKLGGELSDKDSKQTISRVQFGLYVVLPNMEMPISTQPLK